MPYLILNPGSADNKIFDLKSGRNSIGRGVGNDIVVLHTSLSRQHAELELTDGGWFLTDLQSRNGTFVNDTRVEGRQSVKDKDHIRCGEVLFVLASGLDSLSPQEPTILKQISPDATRVFMKDLLRGKESQVPGSALRLRNLTAETRAADKLRILLKVGEVLSSPEDINRLLDKVLDLLFQIMDADRAAILMIDPETKEPELKTAKFGSKETRRFYSRHIINYVIDHGVGVLSSDARLDPRFEKALSIVQQSIRSSMCVPLKPKDAVIGVLYVDNLSAANLYTEEELEFLSGFANQAAAAIENARLYQRIEADAVLRNNFMRFFPPTVVKEISHTKDVFLGAMETEITALFSDISGYTEMSSRMEPREIVDLLNAYFPAQAEIVFRYQGTLEKYIGDALMAVWGAPLQSPDDADRAVRAAVEMQYAVRKFNREWAVPRNLRINVHIGLNSGKVAAGNIGSKDYIQYAAIGDTTNVASRICGVAQADEIVLSETTYRKLINKNLPLDPLPPAVVKGKSEPLTVYRLRWEEMEEELETDAMRYTLDARDQETMDSER